jgi:hypothetical protein
LIFGRNEIEPIAPMPEPIPEPEPVVEAETPIHIGE